MSGDVWTIAMMAVLGLVAIGIYGLLILRNLIKIVVALQIFAKGDDPHHGCGGRHCRANRPSARASPSP